MRKAERLESLLQGRVGIPFAQPRIFNLLSDTLRQRGKDRVEAVAVNLGSVFGKIHPVRFHNLPLNLEGVSQRAAFRVSLDRRRHSADEKIALQFVTEKFMHGGGYISRIAENGGSCGSVADGLQIFGEAEGIEIEKLDSTDRKGGVLECKLQE